MFDPAFQRMLHGLEYGSGALHAPQPTPTLQPTTVPAPVPVRRSITALEALQQAIQCNNPAGNGHEIDQKGIYTNTHTDSKSAIARAAVQTATASACIPAAVLTPKKEAGNWGQTTTMQDDVAPKTTTIQVNTGAVACPLPDQVFRARLPGRRGQHCTRRDDSRHVSGSSPPRAQETVRRGPSPHDPRATRFDAQEHGVSDSGESIEGIDEEATEDVMAPTQPQPTSVQQSQKRLSRSPSAASANPPEELDSDKGDTESDGEFDLASEAGSEQNDTSESDPDFVPATILRGSKSTSSTKVKPRGQQKRATSKKSQKRQLCIKDRCGNKRVHDSQRCETHLKSRLCNYDGPGGCTQFAQHVGLCIRHGGVRKCSAVGCDRDVRRGFVCTHHDTTLTSGKRKRKPTTAKDDASANKIQKLTEQKKTNKTPPSSKAVATGTGTLQLTYKGQPKCQFDGPGGCMYKAQEDGLCRQHGGGRRCEIPGCQVIPKGTKRTCAHHRNVRRCAVAVKRYRTTNCRRTPKQDGLCSAHGKRCGFAGCMKVPTDGDRCSLHGVAQSRRARR